MTTETTPNAAQDYEDVLEFIATPTLAKLGLPAVGVALRRMRDGAAEANSLREQVRTLTAERDHAVMRLERDAARLADEVAILTRRGVLDQRSPAADALLDFREPPTTPRSDRLVTLEREADTLRARVAELEDDLSITTAKHIRCSEAWEAASRERDSFYERVAELEADNAYHAKAQCIVDKEKAEAALATARDAALEEAAQTFNRRAEQLRREAAATAGEKLRLERSEMAEEAETEARRIRALKSQPARRFVEAERVEAERREAWIHGIETAAGIVAERGDDVQAASVVYDVLKARVEFERSHGTEVKP